MTNDQSEPIAEDDSHVGVSKSHDHYNPVILTDTVGALFLGMIAIILMTIVGGLLFYIRKLEDRLKEISS